MGAVIRCVAVLSDNSNLILTLSWYKLSLWIFLHGLMMLQDSAKKPWDDIGRLGDRPTHVVVLSSAGELDKYAEGLHCCYIFHLSPYRILRYVASTLNY